MPEPELVTIQVESDVVEPLNALREQATSKGQLFSTYLRQLIGRGSLQTTKSSEERARRFLEWTSKLPHISAVADDSRDSMYD